MVSVLWVNDLGGGEDGTDTTTCVNSTNATQCPTLDPSNTTTSIEPCSNSFDKGTIMHSEQSIHFTLATVSMLFKKV